MRVLAPVRGHLVMLLAVSAAALATVAPAQAATSTPPLPTWVTDGEVTTVATAGSTAYIGGNFNYVGPNTGPGAVISAATGEPQAPYFPTSVVGSELGGTVSTVRSGGQILASVPDGSGGYYIGGEFGDVAGLPRADIAHIEANGTVDPNFSPTLNGDVDTLVLSGSTLYVGGQFKAVNGAQRFGLAAVSATTGKLASWAPHPTEKGGQGTVETIAVVGSTVYVGGQFDTIGGQKRTALAAVSATTGKATAWAPNMTGAFDVDAIAAGGSAIYVGGDFTVAGGQPRAGLAAIDATTGLATAWTTPVSGDVRALVLSGTTLWVSGFRLSGPGTPTGVFALDTTTGQPTSATPTVTGLVRALALSGSTLYLAGDGNITVDGQARSGLAAVDATDGTLTAWNPDPSMSSAQSGFVATVSAAGSTVFAGGQFASVGGVSRAGLAAVDLTTGLATAWAPTISPASGAFLPPISAIAVQGSTVYLGGGFSAIDGATRNGAGAVDAANGQVLSWNPAPDVDGVRAVLPDGPVVYVGGRFGQIGGMARTDIAAVDSVDGTATPWNPSANGIVTGLARSGQTIYAGGQFTQIGGQPRVALAALDADTGAATAWNPLIVNKPPPRVSSEPAEVDAIALSGSTIYLGGTFTQVAKQTRRGIAAVSSTTGAALNWNPDATDSSATPNAPGTVSSIAVSPTEIYAGGTFTHIGGQARAYAAALSPKNAAAAAFNPDFNGSVDAVALDGSDVLFGGDFGTTGLESQPDFAEFPAP
jgi:hypothetical protein